MMREDFETMFNQLKVIGWIFSVVMAILIAGLVLLTSCTEKDRFEMPETNDVCNGYWQCGWKYQQFLDTYGPPDTVKTDTFHLGGQLERLRTIAYWPCYRPGRGDEPEWVKYTWLYAEFTDWTLVSWVFLDEIPKKKKSHTLYYPKSSHQKKR